MNAVLEENDDPVNCYLVPAEFVPMEWPTVYGMLNPAVERSGGRWSMTALLRALCAGEYQLWTVRNEEGLVGVAVTQPVSYPHLSMLSVQFLGGRDFETWADMLLSTLEGFAEKVGLKGVEAVGRFGFWPFFKKHGYGRSFCTYDKLLEDK